MQVINSEFTDAYLPEFERVEHSASLVAIDSEIIRSIYGQLADGSADKAFKDGISLEGCRMPTKLIPVLPKSDDEYALIESSVDAVRRAWIGNIRSFEPKDIATLVFGSLWGRFDTDAQARYLKVASGLLRDMSRSEFHEYLRSGTGGQQNWTLMRLPESIDRRQLTKSTNDSAVSPGPISRGDCMGNLTPSGTPIR